MSITITQYVGVSKIGTILHVGGGAGVDVVTISGGSCPVNLPVTGSIASGTYQASMDVNSDGTVQAAATVVFKGGSSVTLNPLFEVPVGAVFDAIIGVCTP